MFLPTCLPVAIATGERASLLLGWRAGGRRGGGGARIRGLDRGRRGGACAAKDAGEDVVAEDAHSAGRGGALLLGSRCGRWGGSRSRSRSRSRGRGRGRGRGWSRAGAGAGAGAAFLEDVACPCFWRRRRRKQRRRVWSRRRLRRSGTLVTAGGRRQRCPGSLSRRSVVEQPPGCATCAGGTSVCSVSMADAPRRGPRLWSGAVVLAPVPSGGTSGVGSLVVHWRATLSLLLSERPVGVGSQVVRLCATRRHLLGNVPDVGCRLSHVASGDLDVPRDLGCGVGSEVGIRSGSWANGTHHKQLPNLISKRDRFSPKLVLGIVVVVLLWNHNLDLDGVPEPTKECLDLDEVGVVAELGGEHLSDLVSLFRCDLEVVPPRQLERHPVAIW